MSTQEQTPKVSIVLPTFNCADLLKDAIQSVLDQTYANWELLIIDNFSTDHTQQIVMSFSDPRIHYRQFRNEGVIAASRNQGISAARGDFVAFLDSDDFWYPTKLARCIEIVNAKQLDLVCHSELHFFDQQGPNATSAKIVDYGTSQAWTFFSLLYFGNFLSTSALLVRTSILRKCQGFAVNPEFITAEDYELWLRILATTERVYILNEALGAYRIHASSASASLLRHLRAVRSVILFHHKPSVSAIVPFWRRYIRMILSSSRALWKKGFRKEAVYFVNESLKAACTPRVAER